MRPAASCACRFCAGKEGRNEAVSRPVFAPPADTRGRRVATMLPMKGSLSAAQIRRWLSVHSPFWLQRGRPCGDDIRWVLGGSSLRHPRSPGHLVAKWRSLDWKSLDLKETFSALRGIKRREMLRITTRDLGGYAELEETVRELSALADFCLQRGLDRVLADAMSRQGKPRAQFAILALGKLGGAELNYSSDIDLIFVYSEEGKVGARTHHDFFARATETLVEQFRASDEEGILFRVDLRLRPEGNAGPITRSLESYENYYAAFGEVWERMALQKARFVAGHAELGYEFIQHLQPFCFPRYLPTSALDEIRDIKARIENEILREGGLERHVKLGRGGIREIEFAVQALQLLHGSRHAFLQEPGTLKTLQLLHRLELVSTREAAALSRAYIFLRRLEHRLQMREDRQTHIVPEDRRTQETIARGLGFRSLKDFEREWHGHLDLVRAFFQRIVRPPSDVRAVAAPPDLDTASPERDRTLQEAGFRDPSEAANIFRTLAHGPDYAHVSERTRSLFRQLYPSLLDLARGLAQPDFALQQLERFIEAYGSRATLYELLVSKPKMLEMLLQLFDQSRFLTDIIIRQPQLIEAIAYEGLLTVSRGRRDLQAAFAREQGTGLGARLRSFRDAELLRIELRDILGLASSIEETCLAISELADVCLEAAVQAILPTGGRSRGSAHKGGHDPSGPGGTFSVIALGKYGGRELSYGSDLDVVFVGGSSDQAARLLALMSEEQAGGIVFKMDARLRPDGENGPLTVPLQGYAGYYGKRAQFWERQALTRARPAAGNAALGRAFLKLVDRTIYTRPVTATELRELLAMRERIENERGDRSDPVRDFKTGAGGLVDVEFLAQAQQLRHGCRYSGLRRASTWEVLRIVPTIARWKPEDAASLVKDYGWLRKLESALRRFHNEPVAQLPSDRAQWNVAARHLGLKDGATLERELSTRRERVRALFRKLI